MSTFTLTIDTDNAAFEEHPYGTPGEVARIMADLGPRLEWGSGTVRDINGNTCGSWRLHDDDDPPDTELDPSDIPDDFEVRPVTEPVRGGDCPRCGVYVQAGWHDCPGCGMGRPRLATCGHCGLTWDDSVVTSWTPAPSARCPFEYFHIYPEEVTG